MTDSEYTSTDIDLAKERLSKVEGWIQTFTGIQFWPMNPCSEDLDIIDIAKSLSQQCRYTGHTREFYSVAEHAVRVSRILPPEYKQWGLMHDASEAYLADMASPVKKFFLLYQEKEEQLHKLVAERFELSWPMPNKVTEADWIMLATEKRDLLGPEPASWGNLPAPHPDRIHPWEPKLACRVFTKQFKRLFGSTDNYRRIVS